jgi:diguanylate cyclase (GGDEF)-like protein/PAS domain S-box-containing protein
MTSHRYGISPVAVAFALNVLVAVLVLASVALHLLDRHRQEMQGANDRAAGVVRAQVAAIGDQHQNVEYVLGQLSMRLNEALALEGANDATVNGILRLFQNMIPGTRDLLLVSGDGQALTASNVLSGRMPLSRYCDVLARQQAQIESAGLWTLRGPQAAGRCPPQGTAVVVFRTQALTELHGASLWLLLDNDRFQAQLAAELPQRLPASRYRVLLHGEQVLAEGAAGTRGAAANAWTGGFPAGLDGAAQPDSQLNLHWDDPRSGQRLGAVSLRVPGMPVWVQAIYPEQDAIAPSWQPYLRLWLVASAAFLLAWGAVSGALLRMIRRYQRALLQNEERFDLSLDYAQVCVWEWDIATRRLYWSRQLADLLALKAPLLESSQELFLERVHEADRARVSDTLRRCVQEGGIYNTEFRMRRDDGQLIWVHGYGNAVRNAEGVAERMFGILQDATERIQATHRLADSAQHTQAILDNVVDAIITLDGDGLIASCNPAATRIFGYPAEALVGMNIQALMPEPFRGEHPGETAHDHSSAGLKRIVGSSRELSARHQDGHTFPIHLAMSEVLRDGQPTYIGLVRDITQQRQAEAEIAHLAFFEQLTGLPNRRLLLDRLERALRTSERSGKMGALLMLDLDDFKTLNDTWGHEAGDQLLIELAKRLTAAVRDGDTVARLGGDEFVLLLENLAEGRADAAADAEAVVHKVLKLFTQAFHPQQREYITTASVGVTLFGDGGRPTPDTVMGQADMAMYQAKNAGRNAYRFFDAELQVALTARASLEKDLRLGIARREFSLHYQPQVDAHDRVQGVEALLRWHHPVRGHVSPAQFIPLAEQSGFILELGQWVLATACEKLASWGQDPAFAGLTMAVNVSAQQFRSLSFVNDVMQQLAATGADPSRLKLELTESVLADDIDSLIAKMSALRDQGVHFSLDDFGTGYSSLSYLKRLPLDQLKIDQSFVRDLMTDANDAAIVCAILTLGQSLGLPVIAEGVETQAQKDFLRRQGCGQFQGYLFARPLADEALSAYLDASRPADQTA